MTAKSKKEKDKTSDAHKIAYCENCWMKKWVGGGMYFCPSAYGTCIRKDGLSK